MIRLIWQAVWIAAAVALVVVPFGYAITPEQMDVAMGAGCGLAVGVGIGLRGGGGPWTGILVGSIVGIVTALIAGSVPGTEFGRLVPPVLALAVALIAGLRGSSLSGYRDMSRETLIMSVLLALGLLPALMASGNARFTAAPLACMPWIALMAGLLSHRRRGWRDARPPRLLVLGAAATFALLLFLMVAEIFREVYPIGGSALVLRRIGFLILELAAISVFAFLGGRAVIAWLQPRLRVYRQLADYLRVMWVPIGGFAVGYLTIILLFAGFYGMLERFSPGAFADAGTGIVGWVAFSFFTALGQDFTPIVPASLGAQVPGRPPPDPVGELGAGAVCGRDVVHRPEAGPGRAAERAGRRRLSLSPSPS